MDAINVHTVYQPQHRHHIAYCRAHVMTIIHQYPVVNAWLSVKIAFVCIYIFLGVCAFRQNLSRRKRTFFYFSALLVYVFIFSVARAHHPLGFLLS